MYKEERKNEGEEAFLYFSHGRPGRIWLQRRFIILFSISDDWPSTLHVLYQMTHEGGQCFNAEPITERENAGMCAALSDILFFVSIPPQPRSVGDI